MDDVMNYNDNSACLEVLEGSGLWSNRELIERCKYTHCSVFKEKGYFAKLPKACKDCEQYAEVYPFQPPTSDQVFEILDKLSKDTTDFHYSICPDFGFRMWWWGFDERNAKYVLRMDEGPLSKRLTAALAWLVINKPEELRGVVGDR